MSLFVKFIFFAFLFFLWLYLDKVRVKYKNLELLGWVELLWGVFFLFLGSLLDLATELFPLNQYLVLGKTPWSMFLKFCFYILGIVFLVISPLNWLRTIFEEKEQGENLKKDYDFRTDFIQSIRFKRNLAEVFSTSLPKLIRYFRADAGVFFLLNRSGERLILAWSIGLFPSSIDSLRRIGVDDDVFSKVVKTKKPDMVFDFTEQKTLDFLGEKDDIESLACAPLITKEKVWGVLALFKKYKFGFTEKDQNNLGFFGESIGERMESLSHKAELKKKKSLAERMEVQRNLLKEFLNCSNIEEKEVFLKNIVFITSKLLGSDVCHFFLYDEKSKVLEAFASLDPKIKNKSFSFEKYPLVEQALLKKEVVYEEREKNVMVIPVLINGDFFGAMFLEKQKPPYFSSDDLDLAKVIGVYSSSVIESQRVSEELEKQNLLWDFVSSFSEDMITVHNRGQIIIKANKKTSSFLNLHQKEILGQNCYKLLYHSDNPESCPCVYSFKTGKPYSLELVLDGNERPFWVRTYPVKNKRGEVTAVIEQISEKIEKETKILPQSLLKELSNTLTRILEKAEIMSKDLEQKFYDPKRLTEDLGKVKNEVYKGKELIKGIEPLMQEEKKIKAEKKKPKILAIDDQKIIRELLESILEGLGYQTQLASNGLDGLKLFEKDDFDLVLTDLGMPELSGWEVSRMVKKFKAYVPVILFTGLGVVPEPEKLKEFGVDFFLTKPFKVEELDRLIKEALKLKEAKTK